MPEELIDTFRNMTPELKLATLKQALRSEMLPLQILLMIMIIVEPDTIDEIYRRLEAISSL